MRPLIDLTGKTFGYWKVLSRNPENTPLGKPQWFCQCKCQKIKSVRGSDLRRGQSKECGCSIGDRSRTHGMSRTKVYVAWCGMIDRIENYKNEHFDKYGGRGIAICERWRKSFQAFHEDMGDPPSRRHSLDRINNNGNYEPTNCRWATASEQVRNRRKFKHKKNR